MRRAARLLLGLAAVVVMTTAAAAPERGPYKDVTRGIGSPEPTIALPAWHQRGSTVLWAFATGECGSERWGEFDTEAFARAAVAQARQAGQRYIVSTGGALGIFTCGSDEGMARFLARYDSPLLAGLDFDIEGAQTPAQIDALVQRLVVLQRRRPGLRLSFTLATHAGNDTARRSLNDSGRAVLASLAQHGLDGAIINLMVMNYGEPDSRWCVPAAPGRGKRCDMGRSALQAVHNLHRGHGVPYARIAVTAMPGENDVAGNVFTLADARLLAREARRLKLAGVHHWSIDRDQPCPAGEPRVSPQCHALPGVAAGRFGAVLARP